MLIYRVYNITPTKANTKATANPRAALTIKFSKKCIFNNLLLLCISKTERPKPLL